MKYMGSKNRIAKEILPIILAHRTPNQWWVEPFVGGGNMIDKVTGNRLGSDNDKVFISEYNAPDDFECVWSKEIVSSLTKNTGGKTGIEKLFKFKQ